MPADSQDRQDLGLVDESFLHGQKVEGVVDFAFWVPMSCCCQGEEGWERPFWPCSPSPALPFVVTLSVGQHFVGGFWGGFGALCFWGL